MPTMKLSPEEGRKIVFGDNPDFKKIEDNVVDTSRRWSEDRDVIVQRLSDNTYWSSGYSVGKTEQQMESPYEHDDEAVFIQVRQVEVRVNKWVAVKEESP